MLIVRVAEKCTSLVENNEEYFTFYVLAIGSFVGWVAGRQKCSFQIQTGEWIENDQMIVEMSISCDGG